MITQVKYFMGLAWYIVPSAFITGTYIDLGSSLRCILSDLAFFSLMKHMCMPLSNSATMVSFFSGWTFQMSVTGISISFTPYALNWAGFTAFHTGTTDFGRGWLTFLSVLVYISPVHM